MLSRAVFRQLADSLLSGSTSGPPCCCRAAGARHSSASSSARWRARQSRDVFAKEARVRGLKSRAAFKLLEVRTERAARDARRLTRRS